MNTKPHEKRSIIALSAIFSFRMLGLFMILPIFAIYAPHYLGSTPTLVGLALGIYGLSQALLQIPLGTLSDRIGRKPVMIGGLLVFTLGSVVAALASSIIGVIIGRALQGMGAIGSTTLALLADLTRVENRSKAMAVIGLTIGCSFMLAMVIGPYLSAHYGFRSIFWVTALLALGGILMLLLLVPTPKQQLQHRDTCTVASALKTTLFNGELQALNLSIFTLHATLTACFLLIPHLITNQLYYLPILVLSFLSMLPLLLYAEKKRQDKPVLLTAIVVLICGQIGLGFSHSGSWLVYFSLWLFFTAFTLLEATLPAWVSKVAPTANKGTALGLYSTSQFLGIFAGGSIAGVLQAHLTSHAIIGFTLTLSALWLNVAIRMRKPEPYQTQLVDVSHLSDQQQRHLTEQLQEAPGVKEMILIVEHGIAYLKVDNKIADTTTLQKLALDFASE